MNLLADSSLLPVLIETLWNVKNIIRIVYSNDNFVLIETLWNVKRNVAGSNNTTVACINRNIVECKAGKYQGQALW